MHKKPERYGKEKKRFFQLEPPESGASDFAEFVYYQDIPIQRGIARKGAIAISASSSVESQGREIMIKNVDRKWVLIAKTEVEAAWWCVLLNRSKDGVPGWAVQKSYAIDHSFSVAMQTHNTRQRSATPMEAEATVPSPAAPVPATMVAVPEQPSAPAPKPVSGSVQVASTTEAAAQAHNTAAPSVPRRVQSSLRRASVCVRPISRAPKVPPPIAPRKSSSAGDSEESDTYVALGEYACEEGEGTLDLRAGEKIKVLDKAGGTGEPDEWWFVQQENGSQGWCPASFLSEDRRSVRPTPSTEVDAVTVLRLVRASYDSAAQSPDELAFARGEMIEVIAEADEYGWCRGRIKGKVGIFPANYVEEDMM